MNNTYIRSSKHDLKFANTQKRSDIAKIVNEYRRVLGLVVDHVWENGYEWEDKDGKYRFCVQKNLLKFPMYVDYKKFAIETFLTSRALSTLCTQAAGIINAAVKKQKKRLYMLWNMKAEGLNKEKRKRLSKKIKQNIPQKPCCNNANMEISSKCCDWEDSGKEFFGFLRLRSITKDKTEICIPIKAHSHMRRLEKNGKRMGSFLISDKIANVRWEISKPEQKIEGETIGADQGLKDVLTCSNGMKTPKADIHGHSLESILEKLLRKRKGSKAFKRAAEHRENHINWSINRLNLHNVKEIRLEKITNIGYGQRKSRNLSHWTNTAIRDKIEALCEENGVRLKHQSSVYRSQRCSNCGIVRKANRKGKIYSCKHCGLEIDADFNASLNHEANLSEIPYTFCAEKLNRGNGFYWLESGLHEYKTGRSLESLLAKNPSDRS